MYIIIGNTKLYKNNKTLRSWYSMVWFVWVCNVYVCGCSRVYFAFCINAIISQISLYIHKTISFEYSYPVAIVKGLNDDNSGGGTGSNSVNYYAVTEMHICKSVGISVHWQQYFNLLSYLLCESIFILLIFKPMILFTIMECFAYSLHAYIYVYNTYAYTYITYHVR